MFLIKRETLYLPIVTLVLFLTTWHLIALSGFYTTYQLPGPLDVYRGLLELLEAGVLWEHIRASLYRFGLAFLLGVFTGVLSGMIMGWYTRVFQALDPFVQILRPISPIAWFPLAVLWFKVGDPPAIFIIFISVFFPVLLSTISAVKNVDPVFLKVARNFGTRETDILKKVVIPAAFPNIMVGLHIALGTGWIHLVAGEMLGAQSGLGFLIIDARNFLRTDLVISGMLLIGILGLLLDRIMGWFEKITKRRWGYI